MNISQSDLQRHGARSQRWTGGLGTPNQEGGVDPRFFFDQNPQPMWIYSVASLRFVDVNRAALRKYGYTRGEFLTMTISDIRPRLDRPRLTDNLGQPSAEWETSGPWTHLLRDGTEIQVEISSCQLPPPEQHHRLVVATEIGRNLSIADVRAEFLNSINHAVRTPLNAIFGLSEMLLSGRLDEAQREDVLAIHRCGHAVLDLLLNVFDAPAAEPGRPAILPPDLPSGEVGDQVVCRAPATLGSHVLVADDNRINRLLLARMIKKAGLDVDTAEDGQQALSMWLQHRYRLVFMDCAMPKLSGYQAAAEIRKLEGPDRTALIAVTAHTGVEEEKRCFDCGMSAYLAKPFELAQITRLLAQFAVSDRA